MLTYNLNSHYKILNNRYRLEDAINEPQYVIENYNFIPK
jgi:hypothetical protein